MSLLFSSRGRTACFYVLRTFWDTQPSSTILADFVFVLITTFSSTLKQSNLDCLFLEPFIGENIPMLFSVFYVPLELHEELSTSFVPQ